MTPTTDHRKYPGLPEPFGGWGDDVGDSSLANWDDEWEDDPDVPGWVDQRRFNPKIRVHSGNRRVTVLLPRQARGRLVIRSGQHRRSGEVRRLSSRINRRAPLIIIFRAAKGSKVKSGKIKRCLRARPDGKMRPARCRR